MTLDRCKYLVFAPYLKNVWTEFNQIFCIHIIFDKIYIGIVKRHFLAHLSRRLKGELIVYQSSRRLSMCLAVCLWTFSNSNISATSGPIVTKFYLNHHWGGGKAALGFKPDRIGTLVSMATDSSHRVIMGKML